MNARIMTEVRTLFSMIASVSMVLIACSTLHAEALENGLKKWDPYLIQGRIMQVGEGYCVVAEEWIMVLDTKRGGKDIRTRIFDDRGNPVSVAELSKGKYILAKGGQAWDEKLKTSVLLATEIYIVNKPVDLNDEGQRRRFGGEPRPWGDARER
ncbi:MAG TPA: hypothetical protein PLR71_00325 [Deltaproteobacteria bacterium]|nr:hypothetical protein [Deltaproteobacteria bacterium]HQI79975.1 hypothetical protein [Deltaproteobacteria bacterium]